LTYAVDVAEAAEADVAALHPDVQRRVMRALAALAYCPRPSGCVRVKSMEPGHYRLRVGDYRIGYHVDDGRQIITVWQVGHRSRFYDRARRRH